MAITKCLDVAAPTSGFWRCLKICCTEDVIQNEENGIVVPIGDERALSKAIQWFITHPKEAVLYGRHGQKLVMESYNQIKLEQQWIDVLQKTTNRYD